MRNLLLADWVRFGRRRDLRVLAILLPVVLAIMFVSEFHAVTTPPDLSGSFFGDPPDPVMEAQVRADMLAAFQQQLVTALPAFAFPASLVKVAGNAAPVVLLAVYLVIGLVAGEFEWGTVRTLHLTADRGRTLAARLLVVLGLLGVVVAVALLLAAILPFLLSVDGRPLQDYAAPVPGLFPDLGIHLLVILPFVALSLLMAILARSIGFAFLLTLLFLAIDLALTGAPFWATSPVPWLPAVTLTGSISRLLGSPDSPLASIAPAWVSFGALVAWSTLPALAAIARFRRMDLNE